MAHDAKHIPILCLDVQGFTTHNTATQRTIIHRIQRIATEAARFFMPFGDVWAKWIRHGIGDGYYFVFDALPLQVALRYALNIDAALMAHNAQHSQDLAIRLYGVLVLGDVELVGDQYLSDAFSEAARFLSHQPFKDALGRQDRPMVLAMSALFHTEWGAEIPRDNRFPETTTLQWTPFTCRDKHDYVHKGYVLGPGWETEAPAEHAEVQPPRHSTEPVRLADTISHTGEVKLNICRRLVTDWADVADYVQIPAYDRSRFTQGREPQSVWEWLESRGRLAELAGALAAIGRHDLLTVLQSHPR